MNRPEWKGPYIDEKTINQIKNLKKTYNSIIMPRNAKIFPKFSGLPVRVYNGKKYIEFMINEEMIGHRFGEFAYTRSRFSFKKKKTKK